MRSHDPLNAQIARQKPPQQPLPPEMMEPLLSSRHKPTSKADLDYTQGYDLGWQLGVMAGGILTSIAWILIFLLLFLIAGVRVTVQ